MHGKNNLPEGKYSFGIVQHSSLKRSLKKLILS